MVQVNMNAWQQGSQMYRDSLDRERQARMDDMAAKRFGWEEERINRERQARDETATLGLRLRSALEAPDEPALFGANGYLGAKAPDADYGPPVAAAANPAVNNPVTSGAANPAVNNLAQGLQAGMGMLARNRQAALAAFDMARANGDQQGMMAASAAVQKLNTAAQRASIFNSVVANPDMVATLAANMTRNPAIPLKAVTGENGVVTLQRDDGSSAGKLTPEQMAMVAVHMWDIKNGDLEGGRKGLAAINKELADIVTAGNSTEAVLAKSSNDGLKLGSDIHVAQQNADTSRMNAETNAAYRRMAGEAAQARAAGAGAKGADALWALAERVAAEGKYGGNTERAYAGLKRGTAAASVQEQADKLEMKLREQMAPEVEIQKAVGGFLESKGLPPAAKVNMLRSGVNPKTGEPLTWEDIESWNRAYPAMPAEDILGNLPTREQMGRMVQDGQKDGVKNPTLTWSTPGGATIRGALPGWAAQSDGRMAPREVAAPRRADPLREAYDAWQAARGGYFRQRTPTSEQREKELEQAYLELLRNPQGR